MNPLSSPRYRGEDFLSFPLSPAVRAGTAKVWRGSLRAAVGTKVRADVGAPAAGTGPARRSFRLFRTAVGAEAAGDGLVTVGGAVPGVRGSGSAAHAGGVPPVHGVRAVLSQNASEHPADLGRDSLRRRRGHNVPRLRSMGGFIRVLGNRDVTALFILCRYDMIRFRRIDTAFLLLQKFVFKQNRDNSTVVIILDKRFQACKGGMQFDIIPNRVTSCFINM